MENKTYDELIKIVKQDGYALEHIEEQDENMCMYAVENNGYAIRYVKDQTERVSVSAIKQNSNAIRYINNPTVDLIKMAVFLNGLSIQYVDVNDETLYEYLCFVAVKQNPYAIRLIKNPSEDLCLQAVKIEGNALKYININNQTDNICKTAIKNNYMAYQYIHNMTEEHILLFINCCQEIERKLNSEKITGSNVLSINFIKKHCRNLIKNIPCGERYLLLTEKVCLQFVRLDGMLLEYFTYQQNDEICVSAVRQNPDAAQFVCSKSH